MELFESLVEILGGAFGWVSCEQIFNPFVIYLVGSNISTNKGNWCDLQCMVNLRDIAVVGNFNWSTAHFATLDRLMREAF